MAEVAAAMAGEVVGMAEDSVAAGMVEASVVVAISVAAILPVVVTVSAAAISVGLAGVVLVAIASRNTEEGTLIAEIVSGTIAISFLEVPSGMITRTMDMIIRTMIMIIRTTGIIRTDTTDIRTIDIMRTTALAVSWFQSGRRVLPSLARSAIRN
jgi:hypothetical protein